MPRTRIVQGRHDNSRIRKLEFKNQCLRKKLDDPEKIFEQFTNEFKNLDVILDKQRPKHDKSDLEYYLRYKGLKYHLMCHKLDIILTQNLSNTWDSNIFVYIDSTTYSS